MSSEFFNNSVFWIEIEKINPNPYQPRHEFDESKLKDLAESIRMYGILQPLVVTRKEYTKEDGGIAVEYELISGERRLRASKIAKLTQVPVLIRSGQEDARVKLELAIIENLQREDLNPVDRARSFDRLAKEFGLKHQQIAEKVGKSREYVSNTLRILSLPNEMLDALGEGKITEGHTRPLLMLIDRPEEQMTLFKEIIFKKMTVREAERISRGIATEKVRRKDLVDADLIAMEKKFGESLGTRVHIEKLQTGGRLTIDFFSREDLNALLDMAHGKALPLGLKAVSQPSSPAEQTQIENQISNINQSTPITIENNNVPTAPEAANDVMIDSAPIDDRTKEEIKTDENSEDIYSVKNFSI